MRKRIVEQLEKEKLLELLTEKINKIVAGINSNRQYVESLQLIPKLTLK